MLKKNQINSVFVLITQEIVIDRIRTFILNPVELTDFTIN